MKTLLMAMALLISASTLASDTIEKYNIFHCHNSDYNIQVVLSRINDSSELRYMLTEHGLFNTPGGTEQGLGCTDFSSVLNYPALQCKVSSFDYQGTAIDIVFLVSATNASGFTAGLEKIIYTNSARTTVEQKVPLSHPLSCVAD